MCPLVIIVRASKRSVVVRGHAAAPALGQCGLRLGERHVVALEADRYAKGGVESILWRRGQVARS